MSVDVRGLKITIGGKPIVSDADMTIADGERVGLIGSSGSGKSMIAKAMLGLLPLTAVTNGSIDMGGTEIIGASERALADLLAAPTTPQAQRLVAAAQTLTLHTPKEDSHE